MILTRSPYYLNDEIIYADIPRGILELFIWEGAPWDDPDDPTYTITKGIYETVNVSNPTTDLTFEISNLIRDYYNHTPIYSATTGVLKNDGGSLYVKGEITYPVGIQPTETFNRTTAIDGYGYFMEGANPTTPANRYLLTNDYYIVNNDGYFNIPFVNTAAGGGFATYIYVNGVGYLVTTTSHSNNQVNNLFINLSSFSEDVEISFFGEKIYLELQTECKYNPVDVMFLNKYGAWEIMTFFKAKKESLKTESKDFKNNVAIAGTYNTSKHQYKKYNVNGREYIKLNSGYYPESYNETVRQLLLSEHVYLLNNGNHIPINLNTQSYEFKTRINDKLISHEIDFEYAFDLINNI